MNNNPFNSPLPPPKPPQANRPADSLQPLPPPQPISPPVLPASPPDLPPLPEGDPIGGNNRLKLIIALALTFLTIIGGVALFVWYTNPDRIVRSAVISAVKSPSSIIEAKLESTSENDDKISIDLTSKTDNPNLAGQFDAKLNVNLANFKLAIDGSWIGAKDGAVYLKLNNTKEVYKNFIKTDEGKAFLANKQFRFAIIRFIKKVDGKWIKLDAQKLAQGAVAAQLQERECYQKAIESFYQDTNQQQEINQLFSGNKFLMANSDSMMSGFSDATYDVTLDVAKAYGFGEGFTKSKVAMGLNDCGDEKVITAVDKPNAKDLSKMQKQADKVKVQLGVSGMSHDLTDINIAYEPSEGGSLTVKAKTDFTKKPAINPPKGALSMSEVQKELETIMAQMFGGNVNSEDEEE